MKFLIYTIIRAWPSIDVETLSILYHEYKVTQSELASLIGKTKQYVSALLKENENLGDNGGWRVPLSSVEIKEVETVILEGKTRYKANDKSILVAFKESDIKKKAVIYRTNTYIKVVFDAETLFFKAFSEKKWDSYHPDDFVIMEKILVAWEHQGERYKEGRKALMIPSALRKAIVTAAKRHNVSDAQFLELIGYIAIDKRQNTLDRLAKYLVPGSNNVVCIPTKDRFYQTLATAARRKDHLGIKEYVASLGYILDNQNYTGEVIDPRSSTVNNKETLERIKERLKPYLVPGSDQIVIEDTTSSDYVYFQHAARNQQFSGIKEMIEALGFKYESRRGKKRHDDNSFKEIIIKRYIVKTNFVYISSYDPFYGILSAYASHRKLKLDEYLLNLGYVRIKRAKELPESYEPYDYTDDLISQLDSKWNEDAIQNILDSMAQDGKVTVYYNSHFYQVLCKWASVLEITVKDYISEFGYELVMSDPLFVSIDYENEIDRQYIEKELDILKKLESEYRKVSSVKLQVKRNQRMVKILKRMYGHQCQLCKDKSIPVIKDKSGDIYCEVHHINPLSCASSADDINEIDTYTNAIVLCPYHHAFLHHQGGGHFDLVQNGDDGLSLQNQHGDKADIVLNYHLSLN